MGGQRDLDTGRKQPTPRECDRLIGERRADRRASRDGSAPSELQECHPRLRVVPTLMSLGERLFGAVEIAHPEADLTDLVEANTGDRQLPERGELLHRVTSLFLRVGERTAKTHDLRLSHPAVPWESADGLALAPPLGRRGPFTGSSVVREITACDDCEAVDDAGRERGELAPDGRRGGFVDQRHAAFHLRLEDVRHALAHQPECLQIPIPEARADVEDGLRMLDQLLDAATALRQGKLEVAVLDPFGLPVEQPGCPLQPAGGLRRLQPLVPLVGEVQCDVGSTPWIPLAGVHGVRSLESVDALRRMRRPPRRLREFLHVLGRYRLIGCGTREGFVGLSPLMIRESKSSAFQRGGVLH